MLKQMKYNRVFEPRLVKLRFLFRLGDMTKMPKNHSKATRLFFIKDRLPFTHLPIDRFCFALGFQIKCNDLFMKVNPEFIKVSNLFHPTPKKNKFRMIY